MNKQEQIKKMEKVYEAAKIKARGILGSMNRGDAWWYSNEFQNAGYINGADL